MFCEKLQNVSVAANPD